MSDLTLNRTKIESLESEMLKLPQVSLETNHYFCDGMYAREIHIPPGVTLTGKVHLAENMNILAKGELSVMTEDGIKRLIAPAVVCSQPGIKRVGYAHTDATWITLLRTELTDPDEIAEKYTVSSFEQFEKLTGSKTSLLMEN